MLPVCATDHAIPVEVERDVHTLLGVFLSLRHAFPLLASHTTDLHPLNDTHLGMTESFGQKTAEPEVRVSTEQLVQVTTTLNSDLQMTLSQQGRTISLRAFRLTLG